jgi:hypothetical protein
MLFNGLRGKYQKKYTGNQNYKGKKQWNREEALLKRQC